MSKTLTNEEIFDRTMDALLAVPHAELQREIERDRRERTDKKEKSVSVPVVTSKKRKQRG